MDRRATRLEPLDARWARDVARLHVQVFPTFFLSFLGEEFLALFYRSLCESPRGFGFLALDEDGLLGFVTGALAPAAFFGELVRRRWWRFGWAALGAACRRPRILPRLLRALRAGGQGQAAEGQALLISIGVSSARQGRGLGQELVDAFLAEAAARGAACVELTTDALDNDGANRFYRRYGFTLAETYTTPEGRPMHRYLIDPRDHAR